MSHVTAKRIRNQSISLKKDLSKRIISCIRSINLTQEQVSVILEISQPRVSNLLAGKIDLFSIDALVSITSRLGMKVEFQFHQSQQKLKLV